MVNVREITDFSAPELDVYARLTENQLVNRAEPEKGMFIAESPLVIGRALDAGYTPVSFLMEPKDVETRGKALLERCGSIPVYVAELDVLTQLHRLPPDPWDALRHVPEAPACGGAALRQRKTHRRLGGCHEPHQHRRHHPFRRCPPHGCPGAHQRLQ